MRCESIFQFLVAVETNTGHNLEKKNILQKPRCSSSNKLMCKTCEEFGVHRNHKKSLLLTEASSLRESLGFRIEKRETQIEKLQEDINTINLLVWKVYDMLLKM